MKVESGKWKVNKNFICMLILACTFFYYAGISYIKSAKTYYYGDNIYVRIMNIKTRPENKFDIAVAKNKKFSNCSVIGKQFFNDHFYDTKRTYKELEDSCIIINVIGATGQEVLQIKQLLKDDATKLIIVHE